MVQNTTHTHEQHPHVVLSGKIIRLKKRLVLVAVFVGISLAALLLVVMLLTLIKSGELTARENLARQKAVENAAKTPAAQSSQFSSVRSQLGFSFTYDNTSLVANGEDATRGAYKNKDLEQVRPYTTVTLRSKSSRVAAAPQMTISTNTQKDFWKDRTSEVQYADKTKFEILFDVVMSSRMDAYTTMSNPQSVTINGVDYRKVSLSHDNSRYGISTPTTDDFYFTIQNDRPYWVSIVNVNTNTSLKAVYESVLGSVNYSAPDTSLLSRTSGVVLASKKSIKLPEDTSSVPASLDDDTLLDVVLRNQPAVVRILSYGCGDVELRSGSNHVSFGHVCTGGVGSGSFISSDGYIATNGHVVTLASDAFINGILGSTEDIKTLFNYFVAIHAVSKSEAQVFINALESGDASAEKALAAVPKMIDPKTMSISNKAVQYGVQLSNQPIRMASDGQHISYSDMVVEAKLIDEDYDSDNSTAALQGKAQFTHSDVALLKAEGSYPTVQLGSTSGLHAGDELTAIGFPAYVDGSINTAQWQTVPTITQGSVTSISPDAPGSPRQLIRTNVQIAEGNSGGPAFDKDGKQIGLNTYGMFTCADASQCFGSGTVRDIADLKQLVEKNGVTLSSGPISKDWGNALEDYAAGNYKAALELFEKTEHEYPANYLVHDLARDARKQLGGDTDTSSSFEARSVVVSIFIAVVVVGLGLITGIIFAIIHLNKKHAHILPPPSPPTQIV